MLGFFGVAKVDALDLQQREVPFPFLRGPYLAQDGITRAKIEPLDLARADINVVRAVQVVPILAPEEPVTLRQNLQDTLTPQDRIGIEQ